MKKNKRFPKVIEKKIKELYTFISLQIDKEIDPELNLKIKKEIIQNFSNSEKFRFFNVKESKNLSDKIVKFQQKEWKEEILTNSVKLKIEYKDFEKKIHDKILGACKKFIKSIPEEILKTYEYEYFETLRNQVIEGKEGRKSLLNLLNEITKKHAKLIARTEASRLQTELTKQRALEVGSEAYIWISAKDQRTRQSHKEMNKCVVMWKDKLEEKPFLDGMHGDAGQFPNCRCFTNPIIDKNDLPSSTKIKFYDSLNKKIVLKKKKEIEKLLFS